MYLKVRFQCHSCAFSHSPLPPTPLPLKSIHPPLHTRLTLLPPLSQNTAYLRQLPSLPLHHPPHQNLPPPPLPPSLPPPKTHPPHPPLLPLPQHRFLHHWILHRSLSLLPPAQNLAPVTAREMSGSDTVSVEQRGGQSSE